MIKNGNSVLAGSGYADTIVEDLTAVGLTIVDTKDVEFINIIIGALAKYAQEDFYSEDLFFAADDLAAAIRKLYDREPRVKFVYDKNAKKNKATRLA